MTLSSSLSTALSGLRTTQSGMSVVASNVANAGSANYVRRVQTSQETVIGGSSGGVQASETQRVLDTLVQRQLWTESAGGTYTATKVDYQSRLDTLFGKPGDSGALDAVFNTFTSSVQALATSPDSGSLRTEVLNNAQTLAQQLNGISGDVQSLRSSTESALSGAVDDANSALQAIKRISDQIDRIGSGSDATAALLDQRDGYISQLASLMDIKVAQGSGSNLTITTTAGAVLYDGQPAKLSFDSHGTLNAGSAYSADPSKRSVGTITLTSANGAATDMIGAGLIRSGTIGALVEMRDTVLPQAQAQLDTLAAKMSQALSDTTVAGSAATAGTQTGYSIDASGLQAGNPITLNYTAGGKTRTAVFVEVSAGTSLPLPASANGGAAGVDVIGYTGGAAGAAAAMSAALGTSFTVSQSGSTITVLGDGSGASTVNALSKTVTSTATSGSGVGLPLFVDSGGKAYTGSFDGGVSQRTGFAGRISVNGALISNPALLVQYSSTTLAGDSTRPQALYDALTKTTAAFQPDTGIGGSANPYTGTVAGFIQSVVATQGQNLETAKNVDSGQQIVVNALKDKFQATSGVSVDTEMSNLLQLQNAYSANARVMSTVKDMMQALMNM